MADAQGKFVAAEPFFDDLPRGWARVPLGAVAEVNPSGKTVSPTDETQVTFLPMAAVEELSGRIDTSTTRRFGDVKKGFTRFRDGDLLFAKITPSMENGKIAVARNLQNGMGCGTTEFHVLRPSEGIEADYLRYFVVRDCFRGEAQRQMSGAVGQQRVPAQFLALYPLPLPPVAEQRRIVSRIDELFSRIEAGERAIAAARAGLKRYRRSILKAAVTGALTSDWREERVGTDSTSASAPEGVPTNFDVPSSWTWHTVDQIQSLVTSGSRGWSEYYSQEGAIFVRAQNINTGALRLDDVARVALPQQAEGLRTRIYAGDILVTITGANVTVSARVERDIDEAYVNQHVAIIRTSDADVGPYLHLWLRAPGAGLAQLTRAAYGAGKPGLSLQNLREVWVALPTIEEQAEIISRVEAALSRIDHAEATLDAQSCNARALKQSILKAAFEGRLIPQHSDDEPAADMLARIAGEPSASKIKTKARA